MSEYAHDTATVKVGVMPLREASSEYTYRIPRLIKRRNRSTEQLLDQRETAMDL